MDTVAGEPERQKKKNVRSGKKKKKRSPNRSIEWNWKRASQEWPREADPLGKTKHKLQWGNGRNRGGGKREKKEGGEKRKGWSGQQKRNPKHETSKKKKKKNRPLEGRGNARSEKRKHSAITTAS